MCNIVCDKNRKKSMHLQLENIEHRHYYIMNLFIPFNSIDQ